MWNIQYCLDKPPGLANAGATIIEQDVLFRCEFRGQEEFWSTCVILWELYPNASGRRNQQDLLDAPLKFLSPSLSEGVAFVEVRHHAAHRRIPLEEVWLLGCFGGIYSQANCSRCTWTFTASRSLHPKRTSGLFNFPYPNGVHIGLILRVENVQKTQWPNGNYQLALPGGLSIFLSQIDTGIY